MNRKNLGYHEFLIDGHHVFLNTIYFIRMFCKIVDRKNIYQIISGNKAPDTGGNEPIGSFYYQHLNYIDFADFAFRYVLVPGLEIGASTQLRMSWFDAKLPKLENLRREYTGKIQKVRPKTVHNKQDLFDKRIQKTLKMLDSDLFDFYYDSYTPCIEVPYSLKNEFTDEITSRSRDYFQTHGTANQVSNFRKLQFPSAGTIKTSEKQVDTNLVIRACDISYDPDAVSVCLITNDTDHIPTVRKLKSSGKEVFAYSLGKWVDPDFKQAVGRSNFQSLYDIVRRMYPPPVFGDDPELNGVFEELEACPIFWPMWSQMKMDIPHILKTGKTVENHIRAQVSEKRSH